MNKSLFRKLEALKARRQAEAEVLESLRERGAELRDEVADLPAVLEALRAIAVMRQQRTFERFEQICNTCLSAIFDDPYEVKLVTETKRNQNEVRIECLKHGEAFDPSNDEVEGGVLDIISFALRLAYISLAGCRRLLILDEPFKWVDSDSRLRLRDCLKHLSERLDFQIIMVTHLPELIDDDTIQL